jgi:hypothetical protein
MLKLFTNFKTEKEFQFLFDKFSDKPITIFNDYIPKTLEDLNHNPYNFFIVHEPNEFFRIHDWVIANYNLFQGIFTWNEIIINACPNAVFFDHGCRTENEEWYKLFKNSVTKKFEVSFLAGAKQLVPGHTLRQEIYKLKSEIKIPKKWFYVLDDFNWDDFNKGGIGRSTNNTGATFTNIPKRVCYNEPMFHVAVENVRHNNWYTEKIGEAFASKTVPIYWGCPNIGEYFDQRGILQFDTVEQLKNIINSLTPELYENMKPYIETNYKLAYHSYFEFTLTHTIEETIRLNNI